MGWHINTTLKHKYATNLKIDKLMNEHCKCLARLAIPDKILKCLLTQFSNSFLVYLTLED